VNPFGRSAVVYPRPRPNAAVRLFCLPYAGGGATVFRGWPDLLPVEVEVAAVQLPGREGRMKEAPLTSMSDVVAAVTAAVLADAHVDRPFALFGHSMGALVAYEVTRELEGRRERAPAWLFVAGHGAPHLHRAEPRIHDAPEEEFTARLRSLAGTPDEILERSDLMDVLLPLLRADFEVCETYEFRAGAPLSTPITAVGGLADTLTPRRHLEAWRDVTNGTFQLRLLPGGHFFLNERPDLLLRALTADLFAGVLSQ